MESGQTVMRCRYCNTVLAPSRTFVDGEFCCDDHRQTFEAESLSATPAGQQLTRPVTQAVSAAMQMLRRRFAPRPPLANEPESPSPELEFAPEVETESVLDAESYTAESYTAESYAEAEEESAHESDHESDHESVYDAVGPQPHPARKTARPSLG